ncbi:polyphosphate kinase [Alteromonas sp. ASW11-19]|uniref:Polyphosphate kinase n=1 Tax=Alteromonas salexigens TaxID=2982530 RepID=A0ABT2VSU6_9ALTE|nr:polyphosphate kinase [Alteromonas salexigens]MCU7554954.1 polyphosphate kinase [Alteromonas salexigens]
MPELSHSVSPIKLKKRRLRVTQPLDHGHIASKKIYHQQLSYWQKRLLQVQQSYYHQQQRAIIVFEGWDAAGKGGAIRRLTEKLDPRGFTVYPIGKPRDDEQGKHYLYRFQTRLPAPGTLAVFDRSYYGRVLVERVEGLASAAQWQRAYQEINEFERLLSDDGVRIIKLFLHISADEQLKRFAERLHNPVKRWKLTEEDLRNRENRQHYCTAIDQMFDHTDTVQAPWHLVSAEHKWYARIQVLSVIVAALSHNTDIRPPPLDKTLVKRASEQLGIPPPTTPAMDADD